MSLKIRQVIRRVPPYRGYELEKCSRCGCYRWSKFIELCTLTLERKCRRCAIEFRKKINLMFDKMLNIEMGKEKELHVIPVNDLWEHKCSVGCFCEPVQDKECPELYVHRSLDRRELQA